MDYLLYTPLLPDVTGGVIDPLFVAIPLSDNLTGVRLIRGYVDAVDFTHEPCAFAIRRRPARSWRGIGS